MILLIILLVNNCFSNNWVQYILERNNIIFTILSPKNIEFFNEILTILNFSYENDINIYLLQKDSSKKQHNINIIKNIFFTDQELLIDIIEKFLWKIYNFSNLYIAINDNISLTRVKKNFYKKIINIFNINTKNLPKNRHIYLKNLLNNIILTALNIHNLFFSYHDFIQQKTFLNSNLFYITFNKNKNCLLILIKNFINELYLIKNNIINDYPQISNEKYPFWENDFNNTIVNSLNIYFYQQFFLLIENNYQENQQQLQKKYFKNNYKFYKYITDKIIEDDYSINVYFTNKSIINETIGNFININILESNYNNNHNQDIKILLDQHFNTTYIAENSFFINNLIDNLVKFKTIENFYNLKKKHQYQENNHYLFNQYNIFLYKLIDVLIDNIIYNYYINYKYN
jgi:hypothetical protein